MSSAEQHKPGAPVGVPGPRVRVTAPGHVAGKRRPTVAAEIDAQTQLGEIYMSSLLRSQMRLAAIVLLVLAALGGGLPLLFLAVPGLSDIGLFGVPVPWLILGVAVYPVFVVIGWAYVRAAEANERDFTDVVER